MLDNRKLELINAGLDGELESGHAAELEALLESSEEARETRADILRLGNVLDGMPKLTPPAGLSDRILEQIKLPEEARRFSFSSLFSGLRPLAAGAAFAAGLVLAVGYYELSPGQVSDRELNGMVGTVVANRGEQAGVDIDRISLDESWLSGTVTVADRKDFYVLDFALEAAGPLEVVLDLKRAGMRFGGVAHYDSSPDDANDYFQVSGGTLRVVNQGRKSFTVFLRDVDGQQGGEGINIEFSSGSERLSRAVLGG